MKSLLSYLDIFADRTGRILSVLPLVLVLVQFSIVLMVYVFASSSIQVQESLQYINALMFLGGAGYTALKDEHVRVDLFYSRFQKRRKSLVNLGGTCLLLIPFLILLWITTVPFVAASWSVMEGSVEASGLPFIYLLKSTILLFAVTMTLAAVSDILRSLIALREGKP